VIKLFVLLPLIMCAIWGWYLQDRGYTLKQGLIGFVYIILLNVVIIAFFAMMIYITHD